MTGDTLLLTENGYEKASDLYKSQKDLRVVIDNRQNGLTRIVKGLQL
ncbi:hypothetical protein [Bacillus licheniformis]|nr:hypothetical protein [Bacillus licheniformis]